jgi:hypothetical protein
MSSRGKKKAVAKASRSHGSEALPAPIVAALDRLRVELRQHVQGGIVNGWIGGLRASLLSARQRCPPLPGDDALPEPSPELVALVTADVAAKEAALAVHVGANAASIFRRTVIEVTLGDGPMRRDTEAMMRCTLEPLPPALVAAFERARVHYEHAMDPSLLDTLIAVKERNVKRSRMEMLARKDLPDQETLERLAARMRRSDGFRRFLSWDEAQRARTIGVGVPDALRDAAIATRLEIDFAEPLFIWALYDTYIEARKSHGDFWEIPADMPDPFAAGTQPPTMDAILNAWKERVRSRLLAYAKQHQGSERSFEEMISHLIAGILKSCADWDPHESVDFLQDDPPGGYVTFLREQAKKVIPDEDQDLDGVFREIWIDAAMTIPPLRREEEMHWEEVRRDIVNEVEAMQRLVVSRQRGQA